MRLTDMFVLSCVNERELRVLCLWMQSIFELIYDVYCNIHSFDVLECAIDVIVRVILQIQCRSIDKQNVTLFDWGIYLYDFLCEYVFTVKPQIISL